MNRQPNRNEVEALTQGYLEGALTPEECDRLVALLKEDPSRVKLILDNLQADALIKEVIAQGNWLIQTATADASPDNGTPSDNLIEWVEFSQRPATVEPLRQPRRGRKRIVLQWSPALAASVAVLIGLAVWLFPASDNTPHLAVATGTRATLERGGRVMPVSDALALNAGDVLRTGEATSSNTVVLNYGREQTRLELTAGTELRILNWKNGKRFELREGKMEASVARQRWLRPMVITTPQAEARVIGTRFTLTVNSNVTRLDVTQGKVRFTRTSDDKAVQVGAGHFAVASSNYALASQPLPGKVLREVWLGLPGDSLQDLRYHARYPDAPSGHDFPPSFETNTNWPSAYGTRTRAYLLPPVSGEYEFRISGNGQVCLWLSPDEEPADKVKIGQIVFTRNRPGDPGPEATASRQESGPIPMEAGLRYYIEVAHKYGNGEERLSVTWKRPDGTAEPIPSEFLAPFVTQKGAKK